MKKKKRKKALIWFGVIDVALILGILLFLMQSGIVSISPTLHQPEPDEAGRAEVGIETESLGESAAEGALGGDADSGAGGNSADAEGTTAAGADFQTALSADSADTGDFTESVIFASDLESSAEVLAASGASSTGTDSGDYADLKPTKRCLVDSSFWDGCPERDVQLLTPNIYSRPQYALDEVHDIVIHYVANPGTTAQQNRDYFEELKDGNGRSVSSHFVIGLDGEIIQCISCSEWSYASNSRNFDTISIECCHPDLTGRFTDATYESVIRLTAWLCGAFEIGPEHVIRHYDITGKNCPKYYVENPEAWEQFLADVKDEYESIYGK